MAETADDKYPSTAYNESTRSNNPDDRLARIPRQRQRRAAPITDVRVARIETVTMTPAEETEAIEALAVLIARYWREHPEQAA